MDEELIDYLFEASRKEGFKRNREDFVKYLQSDDELFDYLYGKAQKEGYKRDKEHFAGLIGRTQKAAPANTESVNAEPVKTTEPAKTELVADETTTDYSKVDTTPMDRKGERSTPIKGIDQITVDKVDLSDKEKADRLKDVTEAKKNAMAEDISSKLMPVTEKTEVKEVVPEDKKKEIPTDIKVKEVTKEEPVKGEVKYDIPSYDNLGIEKGMNLTSRTSYRLPKGIEFEKLSPNEILDNKTRDEKSFYYEKVKLNRNYSLRYPDPIGTVFKKENVGSKEVYPSYDKKNNKWYIYDENSKKNNWTEVTSPQIKTMLNAKYLKKDETFSDFKINDRNKIDSPSEKETNIISSIKQSVAENIYLPYLLKNEETLTKENKEKLDRILKGVADEKTLQYNHIYKHSDEDLKNILEDKEQPNVINSQDYKLIEIKDKNHLNLINDIAARTQNKNYLFEDYFENIKEHPTKEFSYKEIKEKRANKEIEIYHSLLGNVFYNKDKDEYYWTKYDNDEIIKDKFSENTNFPYNVIKSGTADYDKIKNSIGKYNKYLKEPRYLK